MLNPFPEVLFLGSFYVPFILRIALGLFFLWLGIACTLKHRDRIASAFETRPPGPTFVHSFFPRIATPVVWMLALIEITVGIGILIGFLTQVAALLAVIIVLKLMYFGRHYPYLAPGGISTYLFAITISLALFISGAGAFAFDIPL